MKIAITTQCRENYGSHDWDGEGECPQYWKCKGGYTYVIPGLTQDQAEKLLEQDIQEIINLIAYSTDYSEEYIISSEIFSDDEQVCDDWESPVEISKESNSWIARNVTKNDEYGFMNKNIVEKQESYKMLPAGEREDYKACYLVKTGELIGSSEITSFLQQIKE